MLVTYEYNRRIIRLNVALKRAFRAIAHLQTGSAIILSIRDRRPPKKLPSK